MKKIFLAFGIAASLVACKKEEAQEFTPSSANVATTSVTGYVKQSGTSSEYAVGAPITLKINKSDFVINNICLNQTLRCVYEIHNKIINNIQ